MGWINHMTTAGLIRNAQVLAEGGKLVIVRAAAGDGGSAADPAGRTGLANERIVLNCTQGVQREDNRIKVRVDWANDGLEEALSLTEAGLFVEDGEGGELLFCIATSYDTPLPVPAAGQGRFELQMELICDLAAGAAPVEAGSLIYITRAEMEGYAAPLGHGHSAGEVSESTGKTVEEEQRRQDDAINFILQNYGGSTFTWSFAGEELERWNIVRGVVEDGALTTGGDA